MCRLNRTVRRTFQLNSPGCDAGGQGSPGDVDRVKVTGDKLDGCSYFFFRASLAKMGGNVEADDTRFTSVTERDNDVLHVHQSM